MSHIDLQKVSTRAPKSLNKKKILKENEKMIAEIQADQYKLYAESKRSVLIVLQGMDASGKDGVVRYIFSGMNPLGTRAIGFRVPTKEEVSHDFLRRIHKQTPAKGMVQIFNRSHYEDILVPTIEKYLPSDEVKKRYDQVNDFEKMLQDNGTIILKFYLHVSKAKQKEKLNERLTDPTKYWKHNIGDRQVRDDYNKYREVYEEIFEICDKPEWYIIPADQNRYKINCIAKIIHKTFKDMNLKWPKLSEDQETALLQAKAELAQERDEDKKEPDYTHDKEFEAEVQKELKEELKKMKEQEAKTKKKQMKQESKKTKKEAKKLQKTKEKEAKKLAKQARKDAKAKHNQSKSVKKPVSLPPQKSNIQTITTVAVAKTAKPVHTLRRIVKKPAVSKPVVAQVAVVKKPVSVKKSIVSTTPKKRVITRKRVVARTVLPKK